MNYETVKYEINEAVGVVTISRPDSMNSFNTKLRLELLSAFHDVATNSAVRAVVLTGEGRCFSAGADLKDDLGPESSIEQVLQDEYRPLFEYIAAMDQPVIAAIGGSAAGIGMSLALSCDLMIMAENAFLLSPFTTISLVPDGGLNWLLVQQLGYKRAFQLSVESERISAARCVELGLANKSVPVDKLMEEAVRWATLIAGRAPLSVAATKKAMRHATSGSWASTFDVEAPMQDALRNSDDCAEGIGAFFEKREANFKGR